MSDRARKKEKQRLKREKKRLAMRRAASVSPYKRIGAQGEVEACYINSGWEDQGLATIQLVRRNPQGGHALAVFVIDLWCAGMKDAWGHLDLAKEELDDHLDRASDHIELMRIDIDLARRLVAGSIRFAKQNGFKLPVHYDRWTNLLGGEIEPEAADVSKFGKDGKLLWVGPMEDLRQRLIATTPEEFLRRPDVQYAMSADTDSFDLDEDEQEEQYQVLCEVNRSIFDVTYQVVEQSVRRHLVARGQEPSPALSDAVLFVVIRDMLPASQPRSKRDLTLNDEAKYAVAQEMLAEHGFHSGEETPQSVKDAAAQVYSVWEEVAADPGLADSIGSRLDLDRVVRRKRVESTLQTAPQIPGGD